MDWCVRDPYTALAGMWGYPPISAGATLCAVVCRSQLQPGRFSAVALPVSLSLC